MRVKSWCFMRCNGNKERLKEMKSRFTEPCNFGKPRIYTFLFPSEHQCLGYRLEPGCLILIYSLACTVWFVNSQHFPLNLCRHTLTCNPTWRFGTISPNQYFSRLISPHLLISDLSTLLDVIPCLTSSSVLLLGQRKLFAYSRKPECFLMVRFTTECQPLSPPAT